MVEFVVRWRSESYYLDAGEVKTRSFATICEARRFADTVGYEDWLKCILVLQDDSEILTLYFVNGTWTLQR